MHTSLRIKKVYLKAIASGEKRFEYRKQSVFYERLFNKKITSITLHYQTRERLTVEVKKIRLVVKPKRFANDETLPSKKIYVLTLGEIIKHIR